MVIYTYIPYMDPVHVPVIEGISLSFCSIKTKLYKVLSILS